MEEKIDAKDLDVKEDLDTNVLEENKDVVVKGENIEVKVNNSEEKKDAKAKDSQEEDEIDVKTLEAKWYVLHTYSGYEQVGKTNLEMVVKKYNLEDRIFDIIIPMEETVEERNGKKKLMSRKLMPCYLLVKMKYADDLWHNVTRTRGITGFVGPKGRPLALTQDEIRKLHLEKIVVNIDLRANDKVEVIDGPLNSFIGTVISVDSSGKKCKVNVEMFGRETPVDLDFSQIRKI